MLHGPPPLAPLAGSSPPGPLSTMWRGGTTSSARPADPIALHLVKQRPEAYAQAFRCLAPVAAGGREGSFDRPALRDFDGIAERALAPWFPLSTLWRGGQGVRTGTGAELSRLEDLLFAQYRRPLDCVLQLPHVTRPLLLLEPCDRGVAQHDGSGEAPRQPRGKMPRQ